MLTTTFLHLPGIGKMGQQRLQEAGINTWQEANAASQAGCLPLSLKQKSLFACGLAESEERLNAGDALWFDRHLKAAESWRLYPHFCHSAAYVDIETTGLGAPRDHITSIALYDGHSVRCYVHGRNLSDFVRDIQDYTLLVTWNGRGFDVPFIRRTMGAEMQMAHLDLLPVFRALNLRGGLKAVEKVLGLKRHGLNGAEGVDGYTAVLLWQDFVHRGDERTLETLLAYNVEDVLSLELLSHYACKAYGCPLPPPQNPCANPYAANLEVLRRVQRGRPGF